MSIIYSLYHYVCFKITVEYLEEKEFVIAVAQIDRQEDASEFLLVFASRFSGL